MFAAPVSTTPAVTSAGMGLRRHPPPQDGPLVGWVLTFPGSAAIAAATFGLLTLL